MEKKFVHPVFFENSAGKERVIAEVQTMDEALDAIREFLVEHEYKSYYTRFWLEETEYENTPCVVLTFDVGSWSEFFHIYFDNMLQAEKFRDSFSLSNEKMPF
jgi:peptidoglycan/xylan/chitin deacetylase (PgdA/CDA1 family)